MEQDKQIESTRRLTMTYEVSYNFPISSKNVVRRNVTASTEEEALRVAGVNNPTLKARISPDEINKAHVEAFKEDAQRSHKPNMRKAAVQWLIGDTTAARMRLFEHIVATGALTLEPKPETLARDSDWYAAIGGGCLPEDSSSVRIIENPDKWGTEYRVSFPIPEFDLPEQFNYQTMFAGGADRFVINSKELFELMVKEGLRL